MSININSETRALVDPIISDSTMLWEREKHSPLCGKGSESEAERAVKRCCLHIYKDEFGQYQYAMDTNQDGEIICSMCGRKIGKKFDEEPVNDIMKAIEAIDGLAVWGLTNGLKPDAARIIIECKKWLPFLARLQASLNEFVKLDNQKNAASTNLVADYNTPERYTGNFTTMNG